MIVLYSSVPFVREARYVLRGIGIGRRAASVWPRVMAVQADAQFRFAPIGGGHQKSA